MAREICKIMFLKRLCLYMIFKYVTLHETVPQQHRDLCNNRAELEVRLVGSNEVYW